MSYKTMKLQTLLVIIWLAELYCKEYVLEEKFAWGQLDFKFPNSTVKRQALSSGSYIPENNVILSVGVWQDIIFVAILRIKIGVVSSFNYFSANCRTESPVLIPYPSFDVNYISEDPHHPTTKLPSESSIINSGFFRIDYKCDRLWVIDDGTVGFFTKRKITEPAIVIFNLNNNELVRRYIIPAEFINTENFFISLEVDVKENCCNDAYAYIADLHRSIIVFSFKKNRSWRLRHNYFGSDPHDGNFFHEGLNFQWNYGVVGATLGEKHKDGSTRVYINPYTSTKTYYISNKVLQNEAYIALNQYFYDVCLLGDRGTKGHSFFYAFDSKTNVLFDAQFNKKRIGCWNTLNDYKKSNFDVVFKEKQLFYPTYVNIDKNSNLWVVSNNYPNFIYGPWNPNDRNMRIYKGKVNDIISGTVCEK